MSGHGPIAPLGAPPASADEFKIYSSKPAVRFLSRGVQPPSSVYVAVGDDIVVGCATSQSNETVTVSYRLLRFDGELILGQFQVHPASDRTIAVHQESLAEGFLLSVSCKASVATTRGQTFARVFLTDPALGGGQPSYMLMADYVTTAMAPAHPNGRVLAPTEGPGARRVIINLNPGPGAEFSIVVPTNARWRLISMWVSISTSGVAVNRQPGLSLSIGGNFAFEGWAEANLTAGLNAQISYSPVQNKPIFSPQRLWVPMPDNFLVLGGDAIQSITPGLDPGDNYGLQQLGVEEWIDNV